MAVMLGEEDIHTELGDRLIPSQGVQGVQKNTLDFCHILWVHGSFLCATFLMCV